jgi:murein DD-endopeptidase MepM/ murein hydrolase activator NlpD
VPEIDAASRLTIVGWLTHRRIKDQPTHATRKIGRHRTLKEQERQDEDSTVKVRLIAPSTVAAVLLTLSTYGVRLDQAIHHLVEAVAGRTTSAAIPVPIIVGHDYESRLKPMDLAPDQAAGPAAPGGDEAGRLTLAVADGETLASVLAAADVPEADARAAVDAARSSFDPRRLRAGQLVTVSFAGTGGTFQGFELEADGDRRIAVMRQGDGFAADQTRIPLKTETRAGRGRIRSSLFESTEEAGIPYAVAAAMIRAFSYDVDFQRDIQPGDRFEVMYEIQTGDGGSRPGNLLYAELTLSGKPHAIFRFQREDGTIEYFGADGRSVKKALLRTPVDGARLSSGFGMRMHPILGYSRMHKGVDFAVPTGTPVYAAGDGTVEQAGWAGSYGRYIRVRHNPRTATAYAHLSRIAAAAAAGQHVRQGEVIGYVGMTGAATGPHLHYEVLKDGAQVNPISVTIPVDNRLEGRELVAFREMSAARAQRFAALLSGVEVAAVHAP